jgi:uncharacterized RDD family membrane protein YckC
VSAATDVHIVPADARAFQGHPAGIVSRVAASAIDLGLGVAICAAAYAAWAGVSFLWQGRDFTFPTVRWTSAIAAYGVVMVVYFAGSWRGDGRTRGNRVLGLRVVTLEGRRLGWGRAIARAVLAVAFPLLLGWAAVSRERRSVQDLLVGTKVVYDWQAGRPASQSGDAVGPRVDVAARVADEPDQGHPGSLSGLDRQG